MTDHYDLIARLRAHVRDRGGMSRDAETGEIVLPNGAWAMMLAAASALSSQSLSLSEARAALNSFQDEVWGSFDGWSKSLGWGLTGIQPECFAMMDASVRELVEARKQLDAISAAIGSTRFMDPPDGGDVSLVDQVRRMRAELEAKEARLAALENCKPVLADAPSKSPDSDLSSLRKGAEVAVKPLEWDLSRMARGYPAKAVSIFGNYTAWEIEDGFWMSPEAHCGRRAGVGLQSALDAAQSDFETRIRSALVSGSREDGASLLRTIETLPDDFTDGGNCCAGKLKEPRP